LGAVLADALRVEPRAGDHLDVSQPVELDPAVVDDAGPFAEPGQRRDPAHAAAGLARRVGEVHAAEAALAEHDRALHPRRPGADAVELAAPDRGDHRVRVREPPDADDRLPRVRPDLLDPRPLEVLAGVPRRHRIDAPALGDPAADLQVPEVDQVIGERDEADPLLVDAQAVVAAVDRVQAESGRDRAVVADGLLHLLDRLEPEARAVLQRAPVL